MRSMKLPRKTADTQIYQMLYQILCTWAGQIIAYALGKKPKYLPLKGVLRLIICLISQATYFCWDLCFS